MVLSVFGLMGEEGRGWGERAPYNSIIWLVVYTVQLSASNLKFNV